MTLQLTWLRAFCAYSVLMFPVAAFAVNVSGSIDADTTWSSVTEPYVVTNNLTVNATLTIKPGVQVQFAGAYIFKIVGTLVARGESANKIVFTAPGNVVVPGRIVFTGGNAVYSGSVYQSGSILENVVVEKLGSIDTFGAVVLFGARPYIHNSIFRNNGASGIYAYSIGGDLRIENNVIDSNAAPLGAGLFVTTMTGARVSLRGNTVRNNNASQNGGGMYLTGVGDSVITSSGNVFQANTSGFKGGGIYIYKIPVTMSADIVRDNIALADNGGGLYFQESQSGMNNSLILRNRSAKAGGGIFLNAGRYTFTDNVLALNDSGAHGGGIDMHGSPEVKLDHSVIAGNKAKDYGAGVSMTEGFGTVINSSIVANESANTIGVFKISTLQGNTIAYNSAESPRYSASTIAFDPTDPDASLVMVDNNIFRNATQYEVFSNFDRPINAPNNWWGTTDPTAIATRQALVRYGASVDTSLLLYSPNTNAPISPPSGLAAIPAAGSIKLLWNANPESDTRGYRVYWGSKPFPDFEYFQDVPSGTNYEITHDLPGASGFIAVSAYDVDYVATNDDVLTPVNENQTRGHESWYALPSRAIKVVADPEKHQKQGDLVYFRITVTNTGPSVGNKEFIVTHTIASGLSYYNSASLTNHGLPSICTLSASELVVTCTHAALKPDEKSKEILIPVQVTATVSADVVSTVTVHPIDFDVYTNPAESRSQVTLHVNAPDVEAVWSSIPSANVKVGEAVNYQVTVKNIGQVPAPAVVVNVTIPKLFTINALDARCAATAGDSTQIECNLGDLAGNGKAELVFNLTAELAGDAVLITAGFTDGDSDMANNQDRVVTTIESAVQGNGDSGSGVAPPATGKRGGGVIDLTWLLMLLPWVAMRRRARCSAV